MESELVDQKELMTAGQKVRTKDLMLADKMVVQLVV
jgi:hypothetical protein